MFHESVHMCTFSLLVRSLGEDDVGPVFQCVCSKHDDNNKEMWPHLTTSCQSLFSHFRALSNRWDGKEMCVLSASEKRTMWQVWCCNSPYCNNRMCFCLAQQNLEFLININKNCGGPFTPDHIVHVKPVWLDLYNNTAKIVLLLIWRVFSEINYIVWYLMLFCSR